jgi:hypothetical protein
MFKEIHTWSSSLKVLTDNIHCDKETTERGTRWKLDGFCRTCYEKLYAKAADNEEGTQQYWSHVRVWYPRLQYSGNERRKAGDAANEGNVREYNFYFQMAKKVEEAAKRP